MADVAETLEPLLLVHLQPPKTRSRDGVAGRDAVGAAVGLEELADSLGRAGTGKLR